MLKDWKIRSPEEANLLNPAFGALIIALCSNSYKEECGEELPFLFTYLILPFILYKPIRQLIPSRITKHYVNWVQENQEIKINIHRIITSLKTHTQEAINFGVRKQILSVDDNANLICLMDKKVMNKAVRIISGEAFECLNKAKILGRWFSTIRDLHFFLTLLGVRL